MNIIDTRARTWSVAFPSDTSRVEHDEKRFPDCPTPPEAGKVTTHGLHIAAGAAGHSTLHAVSHGDREAIEVFDIHTANEGELPTVTWIGCVFTPDAQQANSVVALQDGSLLATIPLETGYGFAESMTGVSTGAVHRWSAAERRWHRHAATEQPYANGIEVSADETVFYVASSGLRKVIAYSNTTPARLVASSSLLTFVPDNLHRDTAGRMITAGLDFEYAGCSSYNEAGEFELERYAACPRPWEVAAVDPRTLTTSPLARGDASEVFSNVTMGVVVDGTLWIGTFGGDRVAYRQLVTE